MGETGSTIPSVSGHPQAAQILDPLLTAIERLKGSRVRIVFPEGTDPRIQRAAIRISELLPTLELILLGPRDTMPTTLEIHDRIKVIDPSAPQPSSNWLHSINSSAQAFQRQSHPARRASRYTPPA